MLNEIAPHNFSIAYHYQRQPHPGDILVAFSKQGLLKIPGGGFYRYSDLEGLPATSCTFLCAVGTIAIYSCPEDMLRARQPQAQALPVPRLRTMQPQWLAFALITAAHLNHWYSTHRFCGACGGPNQPSALERALVCPKCGLTIYPHISPAVIVAIHDGDRLLLTHYKDRPVKHWALVAGYVEVGETLEDTVHREVMEEVGLRVKNLRYVRSQPWGFSDSLLMGFFAELEGTDQVKVDNVELAEAVWFKREELPELPHTLTLTNTLIETFRQKTI